MKSLYVKFVVITIGIMILSSVLAFLISNAYYQEKIKPSNDQKNTEIALSIAAFAKEHPSILLDDYLENTAEMGYQIYLVNQAGNEALYGAPFRDNSLSATTTEKVLNGAVYHGILQFPKQTFVTGFFANELRNTIGVPFEHNGSNYALFIRPDIKLLFNEMHFLFGWILILSITLSILLVLFSTKYLVKPISHLTKASHSLAKGDYDVKLHINRQDELGNLAQSFSKMAQKLAQTEETRKEFISNISHDIQSPLSNIKGYTSLLENHFLSQEERAQYISTINGEIGRLSTLTKQLLLLASLDRNEAIMENRPFNVGQQLKELFRNYQWAISEKGLMLSYSLPDTEINGDPALLNTVWDNLLSNAIKYNQQNGSIEISMEEKNESVLVTFEDTGIGLNQIEIERIFDRFYRADPARTRTIEGTGLGLSIAATIIKLHRGHITVKSKENKGSTFTVELPIE